MNKYLHGQENCLLLPEDTKKAFIFGSGSQAREIQRYINTIDPKIKVFFVNDYDSEALTLEQYDEKRKRFGASIMGSGKISIKQKIVKEIRQPFLTVAHPTSVIYGALSHGCVVAPTVVVSDRAKIGYHVLLNYGCTIGHETVIGDGSVVGPNASISGRCIIGKWTYIGSGAIIKEGLSIGHGSLIGMGAVVTKDVPPNVMAKGVPARW